MTRRRTLRGKAVRSAAIAVIATLAISAPAAAEDGDLQVALLQGSAEQSLSGPLFEELNFEPGVALERELRLRNRSSAPGRMHLDIAQMRQGDGGCTEPETESGDRTCGESEGELQEQVIAVVSVGGQEKFSGPLGALDDLQLSARSLAAGDHLDVKLNLLLPQEATDLVQSDWVDFDLRWTLTGASGEVLGTEATRPGPSVNTPTVGPSFVSGLGATGSSTSVLAVLTGFGLVAWGGALTALGRRRAR